MSFEEQRAMLNTAIGGVAEDIARLSPRLGPPTATSDFKRDTWYVSAVGPGYATAWREVLQ